MNFVIKVPPRTKKNHSRIVMKKQITALGVKHYPVLIPSEAYLRYERDCGRFVPALGIDYPVNIKATYYMDTRRKVDLCNLHEALCDMLKTHGCITDDNSNIVVSMDGSRVKYDKYCPRTEVEIERVQDE